MTIQVAHCPITAKSEPRPGLIDLTVSCPEMARAAAPGQFVMIRCEGFTLRRPISICDIAGDALRLVFEVRGAGTEWLATMPAGEALDILGPQGRGFALGDPSRPVVFIGGGIGIFPLLAACRPFGARATVLLGFRSQALMALTDDFHAAGADLRIATDDGTAGHHGLVTELLAARLDEGPCAEIFACGPHPMLRAAAAEALRRDIPCQVSLEQRMACGIGACLGCAYRVRRADGSETYAHVCVDGPVFDAREVVW